MTIVGSIVFKIDWRRGPKELRGALGEVRRQLMVDIGDEIRRRAPHPSIASSVVVQRSQVKIFHPAAWFWEKGINMSWQGPPAGLVAWAKSRGKTLQEAFAVARAGVNIPASPYIEPAIAGAVSNVSRRIREIWGH